ncbi:MAG: xanthine dehydrogenase family protein molybdopterin-binding subunit, partial [Kiloniellales bacterium]
MAEGMVRSRGGLGDWVARVEDERLLRGTGRFSADERAEDCLHAVVLRSPHANAEIRSLDARAAEKAPGVVAVLTAREAEAEGLGLLPCLRPLTRADGTPMYQPPRPLLNGRFVRFVGDPVAFVVAETANQARDAAELIEIDYEPLPAVVSLAEVSAGRAPAIRPDCPDNRCFHFELGDAAAVEAGFAKAAQVVERRFVVTRVQPAPLEPRSALGNYDPATGRYCLVAPLQAPHRTRDILAEKILEVPPDAIRVISREVGGGFGNRSTVYAEQALVLWAAKRLDRPMRWASDRSESFLADDQGRDSISDAALALDDEGRFLALRVRSSNSMGAYLATMGPGPAVNNVGCLAGVYTTPAIHVAVDGYFTCASPVSAYRGAGRPEAIYVLERLIDEAARERGRDPAALRALNLIRPDRLPYTTPLSYIYDSGDFPSNMARALELIGYAEREARRAAARERGRLYGLGFANAIEGAGNPQRGEYAELSLDGNGRLRLAVGSRANGQGHETVYRQLAATLLGIDFDGIDVVEGDTDEIAEGVGSYGSRTATLAGGAVKLAAERIVEAGRALAAEVFEASTADVVFESGRFVVAGTDKRLDLKAVAALAVERGQQLAAALEYKADAQTYPNGCHACELEIDPETGATRILRYLVVDDFGNLLNPLLVKGQVHGGLVQGLGQVFMEEIVWDPESGQPLAGSFMDYAM